jgi:homoserine kinase
VTADHTDWIRAFAPATVANVACGFDVFGFALERPGDVVAARRRKAPGVEIVDITGDGGRLPRDAGRNTAGIAARHLLAEADATAGVELRLAKGLPLASGLGSSAASGVAAAVAIDALLGLGAPRERLLAAAMEGERVAVGSAHPDNAAAAVYGGFVLVRPGLRVTELPVPAGLSCALVRPHVEIDTGLARALLGDHVELGAAVAQWGNTAALVAGLFRGDLELVASALHDAVAEPARSPLVPAFAEVRAAARRAGALGCSLSGSGPSIFALCANPGIARSCAAEMAAALAAAGVAHDVVVSALGVPGARVLHAEEAVTCAS